MCEAGHRRAGRNVNKIIAATVGIIAIIGTAFGVQEYLDNRYVSKDLIDGVEDTVANLDPLPPGTIVASILEPGVFLNGREDWRLADGSRIPEGALLELVKRERPAMSDTVRLPDLRGMFLRGQNEGRTDGKQDPDERLSGSYQSGATKLPTTPFTGEAVESGKHVHIYRRAGGYNAGAGKHARAKPNWEDGETKPSGVHGHVVRLTTGGDIETRPRNVSVYFYIKID